ncbi:MAG: tetratricopeptide repeat protein [Acidobacteria bacterium]|nr:tetratricopeptide repeat protein [Acidobacteriota bacterium]
MMARFLAALACAGLLVAQRSPVEAAWDLLAKGERAQAVRVLEGIIGANPRDGEARLLLGSILAEDGKGPEAIAQLGEAVRLLPRSPLAHNALGEAFSASGEMTAARGEFEKAVALDPGFAQAHSNLGMILAQQGEPAAAAKHLERAIGLFGDTPDAAHPHYLRAKIYAEQDEAGKAAAELQAAVSLRPDFAEAWSDLGEARNALLDDAGAFAAFRRSVELDPENAISRDRLGAEYLRQGKAHEAVLHLREAFRLDPKNQSTLYRLQLALRQDGQLEEAGRIKEKLTALLREIDRESRDAFKALQLNNEGAELEKKGDRRGALEKYRGAVALDPTHIGIRMNFAVALLRLGQWKEGLSELREAVRRDPRNALAKAALDDALKQAPAEFGGKKKPTPRPESEPAR